MPLQVYKLAPEGLQPMLDTDIYGRIAVLLSFRLPVCSLCSRACVFALCMREETTREGGVYSRIH
jgi:hypothetical protein